MTLACEHLQEYYAAAEWCARHGLNGKIGDRLPDLMSPEVHAEINEHPEAFQELIRDTLYSWAMEYAFTERRIEG